jgi:hypothetical protein
MMGSFTHSDSWRKESDYLYPASRIYQKKQALARLQDIIGKVR